MPWHRANSVRSFSSLVRAGSDRPAAEAMEQIKGKEYAGKYALSGKRITLIGISFSAEKRTIVEELVEEMPA